MTTEQKAQKIRVLAAIINKAISFIHVIQYPLKRESKA